MCVIELPGKKKYLLYTQILPWPACNPVLQFATMTCCVTVWFFFFLICLRKGWSLLVICAHYITASLKWFQCTIGQGKCRRSQWGFIRKLQADVRDANPHFLQHWKGSWTSGEDKNRGGNSPPIYSSISAFPPCVNKRSRPTFMHGSLSAFFHSQNVLTSIYLHGLQHSREMGVSLMNSLPSTAARHQSATTISASSTSGWEVRKWGT